MASDKVKGTTNLNPDSTLKEPLSGLDDDVIDVACSEDDPSDKDNASHSSWLDDRHKTAGI